MTHTLKLDPAIRDWVLIPIFVAMFLISVLRHYASKLMRTEKKARARPCPRAPVRVALRPHSRVLSPAAAAARWTWRACARRRW